MRPATRTMGTDRIGRPTPRAAQTRLTGPRESQTALVDQIEMRRRFASAQVARMATAGADGTPHIVPVCFALDGQTLYFAVDSKPKRTTDLKRLRNIAANPSVS